jgi:hypothetical protein
VSHRHVHFTTQHDGYAVCVEQESGKPLVQLGVEGKTVARCIRSLPYVLGGPRHAQAVDLFRAHELPPDSSCDHVPIAADRGRIVFGTGIQVHPAVGTGATASEPGSEPHPKRTRKPCLQDGGVTDPVYLHPRTSGLIDPLL